LYIPAMRNTPRWILAASFLWSLAAVPAVAAERVIQPQMPDESCGEPVARLVSLKEVPGREQVINGVTVPTVLPETKSSPTFPEAALKAGGRVSVSAIVCKDGSVQAVQVVHSPSKEAGTAAADALRKWKFNPAKKDGQPVAVAYSLTFDVKP